MRSGDTLSSTSTMTTTATTKAIFSPQAASVQRSPWHSPVPYLLGGLAAMLGLIILALVILACTYWKHSARHADNAQEVGGQRDVEFGDDKPGNTLVKAAKPLFEEKIVVIMAGDVRPSFLATAMSSRASSFGDGDAKTEKKEKAELIAERPKQEIGDDENNQTTIITRTTETRETQ